MHPRPSCEAAKMKEGPAASLRRKRGHGQRVPGFSCTLRVLPPTGGGRRPHGHLSDADALGHQLRPCCSLVDAVTEPLRRVAADGRTYPQVAHGSCSIHSMCVVSCVLCYMLKFAAARPVPRPKVKLRTTDEQSLELRAPTSTHLHRTWQQSLRYGSCSVWRPRPFCCSPHCADIADKT